MSNFQEFQEDQLRLLEQNPEAFDFRADQDAEGIYWIMASHIDRDGLHDRGSLKIPFNPHFSQMTL